MFSFPKMNIMWMHVVDYAETRVVFVDKYSPFSVQPCACTAYVYQQLSLGGRLQAIAVKLALTCLIYDLLPPRLANVPAASRPPGSHSCQLFRLEVSNCSRIYPPGRPRKHWNFVCGNAFGRSVWLLITFSVRCVAHV